MGSPWDSDYTTGLQQPSARYADPRDLVGNALWGLGKRFAGSTYEDVVKPPGQVYFGEVSPYHNDLVTRYAGNLALTGAGIRGANLLTRGGAFDNTVLPSFFGWHGTGSDPFDRFSRAWQGRGEGFADYGTGAVYLGEAKGTGEYYYQQQKGYPGEGGLLYLNVKPDQHEFFDWDVPWEEQHPSVKEKLEAIGMDHPTVARHMMLSNENDPAGKGAAMYFAGPENTGGRLYKHLASRYENIARVHGEPAGDDFGPPTGVRRESYDYVSRMMEQAGIPGIRYLDQTSRRRGLDLSHSGNWEGAPIEDPSKLLATGDQYLGIDGTVRRNVSYLRNRARQALETSDPYALYDMEDPIRANRHNLGPMADWLEQEHARNPGHFSLEDKRTRNFVVFNPDDIEILSWNGRPLTPVEGDPFGGLGGK